MIAAISEGRAPASTSNRTIDGTTTSSDTCRSKAATARGSPRNTSTSTLVSTTTITASDQRAAPGCDAGRPGHRRASATTGRAQRRMKRAVVGLISSTKSTAWRRSTSSHPATALLCSTLTVVLERRSRSSWLISADHQQHTASVILSVSSANAPPRPPRPPPHQRITSHCCPCRRGDAHTCRLLRRRSSSCVDGDLDHRGHGFHCRGDRHHRLARRRRPAHRGARRSSVRPGRRGFGSSPNAPTCSPTCRTRH